MFDSSVPILIRFLDSLSAILKKAEAYCAARKIDPEVLLKARLFPDMFPLTRQVQISCDFAKGTGARLAGVAVPSYADTEASFAELQARIAKTQDFLRGLHRDQFAGAETRTISLKVGGQELSFAGAAYLSGFALPNFYFHLTTAYNILRHHGVELGKSDFWGGARPPPSA